LALAIYSPRYIYIQNFNGHIVEEPRCFWGDLAAVVLHKAKQKAATPPITTTKSIPKRNPTKYFPTWCYQIAYFNYLRDIHRPS